MFLAIGSAVIEFPLMLRDPVFFDEGKVMWMASQSRHVVATSLYTVELYIVACMYMRVHRHVID